MKFLKKDSGKYVVHVRTITGYRRYPFLKKRSVDFFTKKVKKYKNFKSYFVSSVYDD